LEFLLPPGVVMRGCLPNTVNLGMAADEKAFKDPLKFAIAQIVGKLPPFEFSGSRVFSELTESVQDVIEDWCSNECVSTEFGYWFTGSSIVDAAELIVRLAEESANLGPKI
jgi:hypothetical protein